MTQLVRVLRDSVYLTARYPKLFLPKLLIAFLYSFSLLGTATLFTQVFLQGNVREVGLSEPLFWLGYVLGIGILDILITGMYPAMTEALYAKGTFSFSHSIRRTLPRVPALLGSVLAAEVAFIVVVALLSIPVALLWLSGNPFLFWVGIALLMGVSFVFLVLFYLLYPVSTLESHGVMRSLKRSIQLSGKNLRNVSMAGLISVSVFLISLVSAVGIETYSTEELFSLQLAAVGLFVLSRLVTAVIATYQTVLNQSFYLEFERQWVLGTP